MMIGFKPGKLSPLVLIALGCIALFTTFERTEGSAKHDQMWLPNDDEYNPNTPGWKKLNERRFKQLASSDLKSDDRFNFYTLAIHSALKSKNFTEYGWALTKAPQAVTDKLKKRLHEGLRIRDEETGPVDTEDKTTFFIADYEQNHEILMELLPLHEAWSGVKLEPQISYGLRVYRGDVTLKMHIDDPETHIISSILHIDHGENDKPWPIVIEDFKGNTNEVILESGDMLFYESSKCMHGRPGYYHGDYYSSIFTHYSPLEGWDGEREFERVPEHFGRAVRLPRGDTTEYITSDGTSVVEPSCDNGWCNLKDSVKWYGPAPGYGKILTGNGEVTELEGIPSERSFNKLHPMNVKKRQILLSGADDF